MKTKAIARRLDDETQQKNHLLLIATVFAGVICLSNLAFGQDKEARVSVESKTVATSDRWPLHFDYYKKIQSKDTPVVVALHGKGSDALVWKNAFGNELCDQGYAVIAVDLRKHGQSKGNAQDVSDLTSNDYVAMVTRDMAAVKQFIFEEHQLGHLNMRKMAIIAPQMSAPIAVNFADLDWKQRPYDDAPIPAARTPRGQDVRALILVSPDERLTKVNTNKALRFLTFNRVAFLFCLGTKDSLDKGQAKRMHQFAAANPKNKERVFFEKYPSNMRGTDLINRVPKVKGHILDFLNKYVKQTTAPWVDRRSRLDR